MRKAESVLLAVLIVALIDTLYLALVYFQPSDLSCPETGIINCGAVLTSRFSTIFSIPLVFYGFIWVLIALLLFAFMRKNQQTLVWYFLGLGGVGYSITAMASIKVICIYCSLLDILIVIAVVLLYKIQKMK